MTKDTTNKSQEASDKNLGTCMRAYHEENLKAPKEGLNFQTFVQFTGQFLAQVRTAYKLKALEPIKHAIDAMLTYFIGVVSGVQDVTATMDMAHCRLPDFYMQDVFQCSCGDTSYSIPRERAVEDYTKSAFWCSGTLNMLGLDQNPIVVFNPYSYLELQSQLHGLDKYLECVSTIGMGEVENSQGETCESIRPTVDDLEKQGVSSIAVLTRCKANYAAAQWDEGSSVLFQSDAIFEKLTNGRVRRARLLWHRDIAASVTPTNIQSCLLATAEAGQPPDACLMDVFLTSKRKEDYFLYETRAMRMGNDESMLVDACEVHTGPAKELAAKSPATDGNEFQNCLDNDMSTQCNVPSFVWSGRSSGKTPVANFHSWKDADGLGNSEKTRRALVEFQAISRTMADIIQRVNETFVANGISAEIFSTEGDALHQAMDCIFMGPYARMDYYASRGIRNNLPVPSWSRRNSENEPDTRDFPLPCSGDAMQGDFKVPFTCGSQTRRAVIKYFVRNFALPAGGQSGFCGVGNEVNQTVQVFFV